MIQNNILFISRYTSENAFEKENEDVLCLDDEVRKSDKNNSIPEVTKGKHTYYFQQNAKKHCENGMNTNDYENLNSIILQESKHLFSKMTKRLTITIMMENWLKMKLH